MIHFVVPALKNGGLHDFACRLQEAFGGDDACVVHISKGNVGFWQIGAEDTVLLQLSAYGFDNRGAPLWLLHEIEKRRKHIKSFGVFFHELYAFGPPWATSFWMSPVQRHIARRLAEMSDFWLTSREGSALWLKRFVGDKPHAVLPIFSTIGEPLDALPHLRTPKVIVFGSAGLRQATYLAAGEKLFAWARSASLEVHDIGAPVADLQFAAMLQAKGVALHGRLADDKVRRILADAMFGLLAYPVEYVAKSSVFAAYCAHGVCPVLLSEKRAPTDGLVAGIQYLSGIPHPAARTDITTLQQASMAWYQAHDIHHHASLIKKLCNTKEAGSIRECG